ncbi:MAG: hypothetical protein ACXWM6_13890, partial [Thermodesulfobacteriota bacterium]
ALYIQSWVGGVWGGVEKIYRAIWLNVNATIAERKIFVKNYFLLLCYFINLFPFRDVMEKVG